MARFHIWIIMWLRQGKFNIDDLIPSLRRVGRSGGKVGFEASFQAKQTHENNKVFLLYP